MSKLFIFDFDGTIADTMEIVKNYAIAFSLENNIPLPNVQEILGQIESFIVFLNYKRIGI